MSALINGFIANPADEILPGLWLGNRKAALDADWIRQKGIKCVFNCTKDIPFLPFVQRQYRVPVDDNLQQQEIRNLELWSFEIVKKMFFEYKTSEPMLVHCAAGMQRSAACIAMFLVVVLQMTPQQAIDFVKSKRSIAFNPFVNFRQSIEGFYSTYQNQILQKLPSN
jgi:dual specificity phosphatase 12